MNEISVTKLTAIKGLGSKCRIQKRRLLKNVELKKSNSQTLNVQEFMLNPGKTFSKIDFFEFDVFEINILFPTPIKLQSCDLPAATHHLFSVQFCQIFQKLV